MNNFVALFEVSNQGQVFWEKFS